MKRLDDLKFTFHQLKIGGGGFVTGFVFHPKAPDILYARTDVGGIYRYEFVKKQWKCLSYFADESTRFLHNPISVAIDEDNPQMLFAVSGNSPRYGKTNGKSVLLVSKDMGETFEIKDTPFISNGNFPARSTAERLVYHNKKLWFASQGDGLFVSENLGESWDKISFSQNNFTMIKFIGDIMILGTNGENPHSDNRQHTLFVSYDSGKTFEKLTIPQSLDDKRCTHNGFVPVGISTTKNEAYITFSHSFKESFGGWDNFACDNGGGFDGRVFRYSVKEEKIAFDKDITPSFAGFSDENQNRKAPCGFGGISVFENILVVCTFSCRPEGIFISYNNGENYRFVTDHDFKRYDIHDSYLKPEYNGNRIPLHWMSNLQINPFNPDFAVINTGTGIFSLDNLSKGIENVRISSLNEGHEETVHLNIYGVPSGRNKVISIVGDLGGFAYKTPESHCENSFADENKNRYITCVNGDFSQNNPDIFVATARGNWTEQTKGGVILTHDGGENFTHIGYPEGISQKLCEASREIAKPNTNSGWCAVSPDGETVLWTLAENRFRLPISCAVRYDVVGEKFTKVRVFDLLGNDISQSEREIKIFSDRKNSSVFYGFGEDGSVYTSANGGETFTETQIKNLPKRHFAGIDGFKGCEIRFLPDAEGECYMALHDCGLFKVDFKTKTALKITNDEDFVKTVGFGKGKNRPAIYISGRLFGEWGFWRSFDEGLSWQKLNDSRLTFGNITSIDGDMTDENRFFFATGGFGAFVAVFNAQCTMHDAQ